MSEMEGYYSRRTRDDRILRELVRGGRAAATDAGRESRPSNRIADSTAAYHAAIDLLLKRLYLLLRVSSWATRTIALARMLFAIGKRKATET